MLWALVFLLGLLVTHYFVVMSALSVTYALWIWFILLIVSNYSIRMTYGKMPASAKNAWMMAMIMFIVLGGTMLLGLWSGSAAVLFALWFLFMGGAMFASGHEMKISMWMGMGLVDLVLAIIFPAWFSSVPFLAAALFLGIPMLYASWKKM